jgi:hypothetical protein
LQYVTIQIDLAIMPDLQSPVEGRQSSLQCFGKQILRQEPYTATSRCTTFELDRKSSKVRIKRTTSVAVGPETRATDHCDCKCLRLHSLDPIQITLYRTCFVF